MGVGTNLSNLLFFEVTQTCVVLLRNAIERMNMNMSARAYDRILKVARTIADLEGSISVRSQHIMEAIGYRTLDRSNYFG